MNEKSKKKKTFRFLKDKWFYISLILMVLLTVGAFELTFALLDKQTRHGKEIVVPDFTDQNFDELVQNYKDEFTFILTDSTYKPGKPQGVIYEQNPKPGSKAKPGRNVYVKRTLIAHEIVTMPNLRNLSLRQALVDLNQVGLKVEKLEFVDYFGRNAVMDQKFNGEVTEPDVDLVKGSAVTLVVGLGKGNQTTNLPDLMGVSYKDVKNQIHNASLNIGTEVYMQTDEPEHLYVCRMEPEYSAETKVPLGSMVNVWYNSDKNFDFAWYNKEKFRRDSIVETWRVKKYSADTIKYVIDSFNYVLKYRTFSYDPEQHERDLNLIFRQPQVATDIDDFDINDLDLDDYDFEIDTTYFYDD